MLKRLFELNKYPLLAIFGLIELVIFLYGIIDCSFIRPSAALGWVFIWLFTWVTISLISIFFIFIKSFSTKIKLNKLIYYIGLVFFIIYTSFFFFETLLFLIYGVFIQK